MHNQNSSQRSQLAHCMEFSCLLLCQGIVSGVPDAIARALTGSDVRARDQLELTESVISTV